MRSFVLHQVVTNGEQAKSERKKQKGQSNKENVIHACLHWMQCIQLYVKLGLRKAGRTSRKYQDLCDNRDMEFTPLHFLDRPIEVIFDSPPALEKSPTCPNGFIWEGKTYRVIEMLSAWTDFKRRGRMARNMQPEHAAVASNRGSLNVGRFYFRVRVDSTQIFDIYYDRAMKNVDDRKGQWVIYRELGEG